MLGADDDTEDTATELEAPLTVPAGFSICETPPSLAALTFSRPPSEAANALVGRRIMRKWGAPAWGWCVGTIVAANDDRRRTISGDFVNFFIRYDRDAAELPPVPHVLELNEYATEEASDYDSWLLLEQDDAMEVEAGDGEVAGGEAVDAEAAEVEAEGTATEGGGQ